jgi:hypothetical protein
MNRQKTLQRRSNATAYILRPHYLITQKQDKIMASTEEFQVAFQRIDTATTGIAAELKKIPQQYANQGLSAEAEDRLLQQMNDAATRLEGIASSPSDPVPGAAGSTTPIPLGQGDSAGKPKTQPIGDQEGDQPPAEANGTIPDDDKNEGPFPGDVTIGLSPTGATVNGDPVDSAVGAQPIANEGEADPADVVEQANAETNIPEGPVEATFPANDVSAPAETTTSKKKSTSK